MFLLTESIYVTERLYMDPRVNPRLTTKHLADKTVELDRSMNEKDRNAVPVLLHLRRAGGGELTVFPSICLDSYVVSFTVSFTPNILE